MWSETCRLFQSKLQGGNQNINSDLHGMNQQHRPTSGTPHVRLMPNLGMQSPVFVSSSQTVLLCMRGDINTDNSMSESFVLWLSTRTRKLFSVPTLPFYLQTQRETLSVQLFADTSKNFVSFLYYKRLLYYKPCTFSVLLNYIPIFHMLKISPEFCLLYFISSEL